jgi:hypothetical protein
VIFGNENKLKDVGICYRRILQTVPEVVAINDAWHVLSITEGLLKLSRGP